MKIFLLSALVASLAALGGCQSSQTGAASEPTRTIEVAGAQARYTVEVPLNSGVASASEPFALQGSSSETPAKAPGNGYQSR